MFTSSKFLLIMEIPENCQHEIRVAIPFMNFILQSKFKVMENITELLEFRYVKRVKIFFFFFDK
jgi:hypothetical protein